MKKLIALALALILVLGLAACASNPDAKNDTTPAQNTPKAEAPAENGTSDAPVVHKIGVSIPTLQEERWQNDFNYFTEEADKMDNVEIILQVADLDAEKQNTQIESMIAQGVEAIIVCPVDVATIGATLDSAAAAGIYVSAYCRMPENCEVNMMTWFDPIVVSATNAKVAYDLCPEGNWVMLSGDIANGPETDEFFTGCHAGSRGRRQDQRRYGTVRHQLVKR
mgnify:CR=1 FL=1